MSAYDLAYTATLVIPAAAIAAVGGVAAFWLAAAGVHAWDSRRNRPRAHAIPTGPRTLRRDLTALAGLATRLVTGSDPLERHLQRGARRALAQGGGHR